MERRENLLVDTNADSASQQEVNAEVCLHSGPFGLSGTEIGFLYQSSFFNFEFRPAFTPPRVFSSEFTGC